MTQMDLTQKAFELLFDPSGASIYRVFFLGCCCVSLPKMFNFFKNTSHFGALKKVQKVDVLLLHTLPSFSQICCNNLLTIVTMDCIAVPMHRTASALVQLLHTEVLKS